MQQTACDLLTENFLVVSVINKGREFKFHYVEPKSLEGFKDITDSDEDFGNWHFVEFETTKDFDLSPYKLFLDIKNLGENNILFNYDDIDYNSAFNDEKNRESHQSFWENLGVKSLDELDNLAEEAFYSKETQ